MRANCLVTAFIWMTISSVVAPQFVNAQNVRSEPNPPAAAEAPAAETPIKGILGRMVQDADGKEMGRIVDVLVDPAGRVRASVIDFGGFLGVGSRKIAVDWDALEFDTAVKHGGQIRLALTRDQLKAAPEYKEDNAVVVISAAGAFEPLKFLPAGAPEK